MSVRVIAGSLKNHVLRVPQGRGTRPTGARVREALFSILGDLEGVHVLDLFAGSGALGIEAMSRAAASAIFVESDARAVACIRANLARLHLEGRARVLPRPVAAALAQLEASSKVDLVFADPPWSELDALLPGLGRLPKLLTPEARVVFEHPKHHILALAGLERYDQRSWGDTGVSFFRLPMAL